MNNINILYSRILILGTMFFIGACGGNSSQEVNIYSTRHYKIDHVLFDQFTKDTGIKVNVVESDSDALIVRMEQEKDSPQADLFLTSDFPRLYRAEKKGLLEQTVTDTLLKQTDNKLRSRQNYWYPLSYRLRIIAVAKDYTGTLPQKYEDLAKPEYKGQILVRSGSSSYNISWVAYLIGMWGEEKTAEFLKGFVANFAREPQGNDRKQVSDIYAGKGKLALINSYYMGHMLNSSDPEEKKAAASVNLIFPNPTHLNISGFGFVTGSKNKKNAVKLMEFMTSTYAQEQITEKNYEYPGNPNITPTPIFNECKDKPKLSTYPLETVNSNPTDKANFETWAEFYETAVRLIDKSGWK
ncbi:MAG: extracellular solute-binding protein [Brevinemataceae bacterium]